jgi:glycosyltransferase involved in cell wall biosynthesis
VIHCVSSYVERIMRRDFLAGGRAEQRKTTVIPDFVVEAQGSAEDEHTVAAYVERLPREPFILFVGSLQGHKGIYTLLEAYQHLDQRPPLVLMGTVWPDSPRSYPPGVTVLHHVPHAAVMEAYRRCLFGVAPSLCPETFGGVITEAMLMNKAVVASNIGGPLDIVVDDATGFLVPPGDVAALRTTMERLLRDGALRERLGAAGRERVRRFDADVVVPQFETLYAELAARTNTRRPALDTHV